jgi:thiol-disulfide isomerase/thioredoxin
MNERRRRWLLAGVGAAALAAGAGAAWLRLRAVTSEPPPGFFERAFDDLQGKPQALSQWRGRWLVLNFWATWCAPCVEEMPTLQQVARDYAARGVSVVGIGIDNATAIRRFRDDLKLEIPLLVGGASGTDLARQLGNPSGALPYTVLLDPQGRIRQTQLGLLRPELLRSWLDTRLPG